MIRKLLLLGGLTVALALGLVLGGGTPTRADAPGPGVQGFDLDMALCQLASYPPDTISPDPLTGPPQVCGPGEGKDIAGGPNDSDATSTAIGLIGGNRLGYPYVYNGPGWVVNNDAAIPDSVTVVGDVASATDLYQDGTTDYLGSSSNCGGPPNDCDGAPPNDPRTLTNIIPEDYVEETTLWGPGTGCVDEDESYLSSVMPGASAMARHVRYRACLDTLFLNGIYRVDLVAVAGAPTPLNLVTMDPVWAPNVPTPTLVNLVLLAGAADSPGTGLTGIDSPQASISHTLANAATNPAAPGLYARWVTEISAEDEQNRALNFVLTTNCKAIGGAQADADADCWADALDNDDANPDQDNDGMPDGIEVAWGSSPLLADTDADGRTDLEEMVGPTQFLTNPLVGDTDGDESNGVGVPDDGGLTLDADGDGVPDFPDEDGDGVIDVAVPPDPAGWSANLDASGDGSSHRRIGYKIVSEDIGPDGAGQDNCPSIANGPAEDNQVNTDLDALTEHGNGDLYGDACDGDDDQDEIVDDAELTFEWDAGSHTCSNDIKLPGAATPLDPLDLDTDNDGVMDGVECISGSNPNDAGDSPGKAATDADDDGVGDSFEIFQRSFSFSGAGSEDFEIPVGDGLIGDDDPDSDGDGLSDGCEAFVTGTSLASTDSDEDGDLDGSAAETNVAALAGLHCTPNVADPEITMTITGAEASITRTVAGAVADDVELTFTEPGGVNIVSVWAGLGTSTCLPTAGVEAPAGTWTVTWSPACVANGQTIRVLVGYTGSPAPTLTGVTWTLVGVPIGAQGGAALVIVDADDMELTLTVPVGTVVKLIAAGDGTSICPWRLGWRIAAGPPEIWRVKWPFKCVGNGQKVRVLFLYKGTSAPTVAVDGVMWSDPGLKFGPDPGPYGANVLSAATATDVDGDSVLNGSDNCPWVPNPDQANTDPKIGNGKGVAGDDTTVPWSNPGDKRGDACDGDKDNDGLPDTGLTPDPDSAGAGDITYDDNDDGTWKGAGDDGTAWDGDLLNAKLDGREGLCPLAGNADTDGDGLLDKWEYCKWGSSPIKVDSDGNGKGDCTEVVDTNGDGSANLGDVVNAAKAGLLGASFGQDGDFDINGDNAVNISDVVEDAKFALIAGRCK